MNRDCLPAFFAVLVLVTLLAVFQQYQISNLQISHKQVTQALERVILIEGHLVQRFEREAPILERIAQHIERGE